MENISEYAPYAAIVIMYLIQNKVFVRPSDLEKKHREILKEIKEDFVDLNAYRELQNYIYREIKDKYVELNAYKEFQNHIYSKLEEVNESLNEIKSRLMKG